MFPPWAESQSGEVEGVAAQVAPPSEERRITHVLLALMSAAPQRELFQAKASMGIPLFE
jgi:hypothetical protein